MRALAPRACQQPNTNYNSPPTTSSPFSSARTHVQNLQFKKAGSQSKYLSGKKTEDTIYKCIGISVKLGGVDTGFSAGIESYFQEFVGESIESPTSHATLGDGLHFTFYGPPTMISALRSEGNVGDDPVRAGDVVNLGTKGASLFLNSIEVVSAERDKDMASQHQVTNLYHAPAVNVDDGLAENIKKAQALIKVRRGGGAKIKRRGAP